MVFARLFLAGGFFGLGCFFLGAAFFRHGDDDTVYNVVGEPLYMLLLHRLLDSFKPSPIMKLH